MSALEKNHVKFWPTEPYVRLNLTLDSRKKIGVEGTVWNMNSQHDATLNFKFATNLTCLDIFAKGIQAIVERFPRRK
ncbi:MAG TPA: hypothetical protein DHD79_03520 [Firmicutes bacterium]|nr:hypothetical protein [Bacillota bacterium]HCX70292.1 hypothetical protein [Bacillota bacterium]